MLPVAQSRSGSGPVFEGGGGTVAVANATESGHSKGGKNAGHTARRMMAWGTIRHRL